MRRRFWTMLACAPFLAAASACSTAGVTQPCDVLVAIPDAPPAVNAMIVRDARATATGLARHKGRVQRYGCGK